MGVFASTEGAVLMMTSERGARPRSLKRNAVRLQDLIVVMMDERRPVEFRCSCSPDRRALDWAKVDDGLRRGAQYVRV